NRDNNHVFLELFALKMIHLLSSHSFLLHFTINQVLWGTLQQNHQYKDEVNALKEKLENLQEQIKVQKRIEEQEKPRKWWELWRK
ncbi:hypothetical protein ACI1UC_11555, partial [Lactococcus formosensis subsp. bovis]